MSKTDMKNTSSLNRGKTTIGQNFQIFALTPPGLPDPAIAIAASRAGGIGILDLEYISDVNVALESIRKMVRYSRNNCGIKLNGLSDSFITHLIPELPEDIGVVIFTKCEPEKLHNYVKDVRCQKRLVMLEINSLEQAMIGEQADVDGLIAKGNEAAGLVGEKTAFILLQQLRSRITKPLWIQGGVGLHTATACYTAGAAGIVLDSQLALTRESPLPENVKKRISVMDGTETVCVGNNVSPCRIYGRPGHPLVNELFAIEESSENDSKKRQRTFYQWHEAIRERISWEEGNNKLWLLGQDVAFAAPLATRYDTVGQIMQAFRRAIDENIQTAKSFNILEKESPLARSHETEYPIVQGPMARVSDNAAFMADVSEAGGLPFLALSKLSGDKSKKLLEEVDDLLGTKPWGIGILGFNDPALFQSQMEAINSYPPRFAIIAGGMPNQVAMLESKGIQTYVHMQSASVMEMFIDEGARRFIFEGRECGGHIGPRSCFVLWEDMMGKLLEILENTSHEPEKFHVLFAGGIHDALSAAMVASLAAPIVKAGVRVGVVMGTAYLFTEEIVKTGAIVKGFQKHALQCSETTVLETGPGHAIRCCKTPYVNFFENEKKKLQHKGLPQDQIRSALEALVVGRLRIASKGIARNRGAASQKDKTNAREISEKDQHAEGIYMVGQLTAMRNKTQSIKDLHKDVSEKSSLILSERCEIEDIPRQLPSDIAIIGMACVFPKAGDLQTYWENILYKVNAITEAPTSRWDWQLYFDKNRKTKDKIYSRWGGFLDEIPFDPMKYGIPPASLDSIEPLHLMTLEVVSAALKDAGYERKEFPREKTSVIIGTGAGIGDLGQKYIMRSTLPLIFDMHSDDVMRRLPEWTEDSFPGILMNVTAGRVANRFDLGGVNYTVDAACASSLSALYDAVRELETGSSDMAIAGGIDAGQSPFTYLCFSKTQALSPSGKCRVFDEKANGTVISEGLALLVLKRLSDAERDGDRIYAVIKSVAGSSDGRDKSLTAPRPDGQLRALKKAYDKAGFSPETVELIEAHGTGTVVGDRTEAESVSRLLEENHAPKHGCAIGSVKSMIGHTKGAAGLAGVIKVALSLYHNVLPPTMGVDRPNEHIDFMKGPLYVNTELRPWIGSTSHGRRAGVNAFGFGGTNFHAILEEYGDEYRKKDKPSIVSKWPAELFLCSAYSRDELVSLIDNVELALKGNAALKIRELAYALYADYKEKTIKGDSPLPRLAFVASSVEEATEKLTFIRQSLNDPSCEHLEDPRGIYFSQSHRIETGKIAFLFPGQGSQYPNMLRDLSILFPEMRSSFEQADSVLSERLPERLSSYVFPPPHFSKEEEKQQRKELARTNIAQPALGAACQGVFNLLRNLNLHPDMVAGHSYGEYAALCASGVVNEMTLYEISEARGRLIIEAAQGRDLGTMAAVEMEASELSSLLKGIEGVVIANINSPKQTVISGEKSGILKALAHLESMDINARQIPVSAAFHSPKVEPAKKLFSEYLKKIPFSSPEIEVFSNTYAASYNRNTQKIKKCLSEHMVRPVKFVNEIEEMYKQGARIFIEVGPGSVLTNLTKQILGERAIAVSTDNKGREGLTHLLKTLGKLAMHGVPLSLERLYEGRSLRKLDLNSLSSDIEEKHSQTTWLVNGSHIIHPNRKKKQRNGNVALEAYKLRDRRLSGEQKKDEDLKNTELSSESDERSEAQMKRYSDVTFSTPQEGKRDKTSLPGASEFKKVPSTESHVSPDNMDAVMVQYQKLMNNFLETQKSIMLSYLQGNAQSIDQDFASESSLSQIRTEKVPVEKDSLHHAQADKPVEQAHPSQVDSAEEGIDTEKVKEELLRVTSEHTGYPQEMLNPDLDMEADLGIDSIKRVEILNAFTKCFNGSPQEILKKTVEELSRLKTLRAVWEKASEVLVSNDGQAQEFEITHNREEVTAVSDNESVPRFLLEPHVIPVAKATLQIPKDSVFIITDDGRGLSVALAQELRGLGGQAVILRTDSDMSETDSHTYNVDLTDFSQVKKVLDAVEQEYHSVAGIIHLLPLSSTPPFNEMDLQSWRRYLKRDVKSLFYLARLLGPKIRDAGRKDAGWIVAATNMNSFSNGSSFNKNGFVGQAGIAGLLKTLSLEWQEVRCKAIDFDMSNNTSMMTGQLLREMAVDDDHVELTYRGTERIIYKAKPAPLYRSTNGTLHIESDWVVLVTGGAAGITAEIAYELAMKYQPTLLLVGRSPLPEEDEPTDMTSLTSPKEIKAKLIERLQSNAKSITPAMVESAYAKFMKSREIRNNMRNLQQAGATVHYYQADVRDEEQFGHLIDEMYRTHGKIDGVIHGAGIIEDKLLEDKSPDSFDRVFDTKTDSAFILTRNIQPASLKFIAFFTSVAGCFGNRGQSDYAAANEVLNKLALYLDHQYGGRVVAINWGPWKKLGMVSPELEKKFNELGIQLILPSVGPDLFDQEITWGDKGKVQIVIGDGPWKT